MFNLAYWKSTAEYVVTAFVTAFVGTIVAQQKFTSTSLIAAATAGGLGALTVLVKHAEPMRLKSIVDSIERHTIEEVLAGECNNGIDLAAYRRGKQFRFHHNLTPYMVRTTKTVPQYPLHHIDKGHCRRLFDPTAGSGHSSPTALSQVWDS